jgi:filamentous hemagglutinin
MSVNRPIEITDVSDFRAVLSAVLSAVMVFGGCPAVTAKPLATSPAGLAAASASTSSTSGVATGSSSPGNTASSQTARRSSRLMESVQQLQAAARAAVSTGIPNGLASGGLEVDTGATAQWDGASPLTDGSSLTSSSGQTTVTVKQTSEQALLNWKTFNVGKQTTLVFDQSSGGADATKWIAFNTVNDPSANPTRILGSITAPGQVYIINRNGIIFGASSQVNTHALVASTLPINANLIERGLLNNPDAEFLFSATELNNQGVGSVASGTYGDVIVEAGAQITAPTTADHVGGRVALFGANVINAGTISTPDGQTILGAGLQIGLTAHDSDDASLRGLDVYVGRADAADGAGTVINSGLIEAARAAVTLAGREIQHTGVIDSSTSVSYNGRVDLLASYGAVSSLGAVGLAPFLPTKTGIVTLGKDSVLRILPEIDSIEKVVGSSLSLNSQVNIDANVVHFEADSILLAPGAGVTVRAGNWLLTGSGSTLRDTFGFIGGQIYLDSGATIDASGSSGVAASVTDNIIAVELRGTELANSPLQRDGALRGQTVYADIRESGSYDGTTWIGSPLGDLSGYAELVDRSVGELTVNGGSVKLNAGGSVVIRSGSQINVSGGTIDYAGGTVTTSSVKTSDGRILDISAATPDLVYTGIYDGTTSVTDSKWGVSKVYTDGLFRGSRYESGYTYGGNAGTVSITAPSMVIDGTLLSTTVAGERQLASAPAAGTLNLAFTNQYQDPLNAALLLTHAPSAPVVTFVTTPTLAAPANFALATDGQAEDLDVDRKTSLEIDTHLFAENGFGSLSVENSDGDIVLPFGETLSMERGGTLSLNGANVSLLGNIIAPGLTLTARAYSVSPYLLSTEVPVFDPSRGQVVVGSSAIISTAGLLLDGSNATDSAAVQTLGGGRVTLQGYSVELAAGSLIDVSGGAYISPVGKVSYGDGGSISLLAGRDISYSSFSGGALVLGGELLGYSGADSGSLSLQAPAIQVGSGDAATGTLVLSADFFDQGGFATFSLKGLGLIDDTDAAAVRVTSGTTLSPAVTNSQVVSDAGSGYRLENILLDPFERTPVTIKLTATGVADSFSSNLLARGDVRVDTGVVVDAGPGGTVNLNGQTVYAGGTVKAAGGSVSVAGAVATTTISPDNLSTPEATVVLDSGSLLSTAGTTLLTSNALGYHTGAVLDGGKVSVSGNVVARDGARIDVSGASDTLDVLSNYVLNSSLQTSLSRAGSYVSTRVDSDGGTISLTGSEFLFSDATLTGNGGGSDGLAGRLEISSGRYYPTGIDDTPADITLNVSSTGTTLSSLGTIDVGQGIAASGGLGHVTADKINAGGFAEVALGGNLEFQGDVSLSAGRSLELADGGFLYAEGSVSLRAPYVKLGTDFLAPHLASEEVAPFILDGVAYNKAPVYGSGRLEVEASTLIDLGNLSLQNVGSASFAAVDGDIRGDGTLSAAGDFSFNAGQVYVPTAVGFTIAVENYTQGGTQHAGSVTFNSESKRSLPLSAGGTLNVYAASIQQSGVLRAPIGSINLGWNGAGTAPVNAITGQSVAVAQTVVLGSGSETSVSAVDPLTGVNLTMPYGVYLNGAQWVDPTSLDITSGGGPVKSVEVSGVNVITDQGATVDVRGGGDLHAYHWVSGTGGTVDVLANEGAFAVIPGYGAGYAPYAAYNKTSLNDNLGNDAGYVNSTLSVGDSIYLAGGGGIAGGYYTLLPARYALLPGAFLVVPGAASPAQTAVKQNDGSYSVSGYRYNALSGAPAGPLLSSFDIVSADVLAKRAEYKSASANDVLAAGAVAADLALPRLPVDSGQLVLAATTSMNLAGSVLASAPTGARGGLVDISTPGNILVTDADSVPATPGTLVLNVDQLNAYGSESLLIGGVRHDTSAGTSVDVTAANITLDNGRIALTGSDIILVGTDSVSLSGGSSIIASGSASGKTDTLVMGSAESAGSGTGAAVRVGTTVAAIDRRGVDSAGDALLSVSDGAQLSGTSIVLDSSNSASLDAGARFTGSDVSLNSGRVSLLLDGATSSLSGAGLVLSGAALSSLQGSVDALSLLSYSTIDIYGSGSVGTLDTDGVPVVSSLTFKSGGFRGFDTGGGDVTFAARTITIDNSPGSMAPVAVVASDGKLNFITQTLKLGAGHVEVSQFTSVSVDASAGVVAISAGSLGISADLSVHTPVVTATLGTDYDVKATGAVVLASRAASSAAPDAGLGASLSLQGATVRSAASILLPSGRAKLTATSGDLEVSGLVDVSGVSKTIQEATVYTDGGAIALTSSLGSVLLTSASVLDVSAASAGGDAGSVDISAAAGTLVLDGTLHGEATNAGGGGAFTLDVGLLADLSDIDPSLNAGGFDSMRDIRVRSGDVRIDDFSKVSDFSLTADAGSIHVGGAGKIDASGKTGGVIALTSSGSVVLEEGAQLTVAADDFNAAGKGGKIDLSAGSEVNGAIDTTALLDIRDGSRIDLSVDAASDATLGLASGVLHLRAPQNSSATDLQIEAIDGSVVGASRIVVEGYKLFDLSNTAGSTITSTVQGNVTTNATTFIGNTDTITSRLLADNAGLASLLSIEPGAEIVNRTGDLTLASTWNLANARFGAASVPGNLILRAGGNLVFSFKASLNDGFVGATYTSALQAVGTRSWSYTLVAGADVSSASVLSVLATDELASDKGSFLFGQGAGALPSSAVDKRSSVIPNFYQVIRTGTGDIDIATGRDVQILNPLGTIYTSGSQAADIDDFDRPSTPSSVLNYGTLGSNQAPYFRAQYSLAGGDVVITAGSDIIRLVEGQANSTREMPTNWLYRRGYVDPATGEFGKTTTSASAEVSSTSWWIDYSNFFQGVGALGGGNVTLIAGRDVSNVDAVIPTNARMTKGSPSAANLQELGGGDLLVIAGRDIDGGVYYVERGSGTLAAGDDIQTNSTRAALSRVATSGSAPIPDASTWLPTTLFVGKSSFDVSARDDLLLGPVANPFWLPQGINNNLIQKSYFNTYAPDSGVRVQSLTGDVTLRSDPVGGTGSLYAWYLNVLQYYQNPGSYPDSQPWLRTVETSPALFATAATVLPPVLAASAFSGDINVVGSLTLAPSAIGTIDLLANGSVNGLQINGLTQSGVSAWSTGAINLSDADPAALPGIITPLNLVGQTTTTGSGWLFTPEDLFLKVDALFDESGSITEEQAVIQTKQNLHGQLNGGTLHSNDDQPVRIYAGSGDVSGLTLFAGKSTEVIAGRDLSDISIYVQNNTDTDVTRVVAGRDLTPYATSTPLRLAAQASGNMLFSSGNGSPGPLSGNPTTGDIQIGGPGTLQLVAGRDFDLGAVKNNADGTASGVTSVGNARNPYLPFAGASIDIAAGVGSAVTGDVARFDAHFLDPATAGVNAERYLPVLAELIDLKGADNDAVWTAYSHFPAGVRARLTLAMFYRVLRDAGRDHNSPDSDTFGTYDNGFAAIEALFPGKAWNGDISIDSRLIKTASGGHISIYAPGGGLDLGSNRVGNTDANQGILTESGGDISIFTRDDVGVGSSRIFTLRGGDEIIWSSTGDIAAGISSKTVQSAPPTRVLIDPQSADVETDLAGLATGGGIGVLETVAGLPPSDVDLIAPVGTIDAGDAGIRSSGNLNIAAAQVLNATNIQVSGASAGTTTVSVPSLGSLVASAGTTNTTAASSEQTRQTTAGGQSRTELPSIYSIEVIGYGGGSGEPIDTGSASAADLTVSYGPPAPSLVL